MVSEVGFEPTPTYTELPLEEARDYGQVKAAIFHRYAITPEASRRRFRAMKLEHEETASAFVARVRDTGNCWLRQAASRNAVVELVLLEQRADQGWLRPKIKYDSVRFEK